MTRGGGQDGCHGVAVACEGEEGLGEGWSYDSVIMYATLHNR
jgi:hypothetical protein